LLRRRPGPPLTKAIRRLESTAMTCPACGAALRRAAQPPPPRLGEPLIAHADVGELGRLSMVAVCDYCRRWPVRASAAPRALSSPRAASAPRKPNSFRVCGEIRGVTALVSNGIPDGSAILLDAAQIAAAATEIDVQVASSATLDEMADDPHTIRSHRLAHHWSRCSKRIRLRCARPRRQSPRPG
jgi:hypothetical protein